MTGIHLIADDNILEIQGMDLNMGYSLKYRSGNTGKRRNSCFTESIVHNWMRKLPGEHLTIRKGWEEKRSMFNPVEPDFRLTD
jgi:hypothetical protein